MGSASHDSERAQKKRKTREEAVAAEPEPEIAPPTKKRKHRVAVEEEQADLVTQDITTGSLEPDDDDAAVNPAPRKEKRKKDRRAKLVPEEPAPAPSVTRLEVEQPSGKRAKYPDPSTDESLSDQSQKKSLIYAYQYVKGQSFKFNKGRQNWLMRNYYSNQVPDAYVKTVLKYLKSAQGQAVVHMRQTCEGILAQADEAVEAEAPAAEAATESGLDASKAEPMDVKERRRRAKKLLKALPPTN